MGTFRFKAFISYSHQDRKWGSWVQRSLEGYRIPRRLVGSEGEFGPIPRRLTPVFRDREDLSSAADLSVRVREHLEASEAMIIICSPASAQSAWVNEEIRHFKSLGRQNRIFALIVDGDPQAKDPGFQCFPSALISNPDGSSREPLAADARKWADGKLLAKLKLIAGILGIGLDELRRRDMQRRHRLWMASAGSAGLIAIVMTVLAVVAVTARTAAENRREHAENLVGYMVGDLKSKLDEVGRLDILEGVGGRVGEYLATLDPGEVTDESLKQQAQVWRQLGEVGMDQGKLDESLKAFTASRDIMGELHRRNPASTEYIYELGNAEFWVGYVFYETGEFQQAEDAFGDYLGYAYQLIQAEPANPEWLMEKSYAHSNLAALINRRGDRNVEAGLAHIKQAAESNLRAMELAPGSLSYESEYSEILAWLADTQLAICDLGGALQSRRESVARALSLVEVKPGNANYRTRYAYTLTGLANVASQVGLADLALESFAKSREILGQLSVLEPSNMNFRFEYLKREFYMAKLISDAGELDEALVRVEMIREPLEQVLEAEHYENLGRHISYVRYLLAWSDMSWRAGRRQQAIELMAEVRDHLGQLLEKEYDRKSFEGVLLDARFTYWEQNQSDLFDSGPFSEADVHFDDGERSCFAQANLVRQAILANKPDVAGALTTQLLAKGYFEPGFVRTCRQFELCN